MNIYVLKGKWFLACLCVIIGAGAIFGMGAAVSVFRAGNRNIPIYSVERLNDKRIALTFDCAWNADDIDSILGTLDQYSCKATFFMVGDWAEKYPESVKKIHEKGHEIGSHSYNHKDYTKLSKKEQLEDMQKCDEAIKKITGEAPRLFRAPSGGYNNSVVETAEESGRIYIQWSVDGLDYTKNASPDSIYKRISEQTEVGDIILLHNGTEYTAQTLPRILDYLCGNFEPVKVSEMLYDDFVLDSTGRMFKKDK